MIPARQRWLMPENPCRGARGVAALQRAAMVWCCFAATPLWPVDDRREAWFWDVIAAGAVQGAEQAPIDPPGSAGAGHPSDEGGRQPGGLIDRSRLQEVAGGGGIEPPGAAAVMAAFGVAESIVRGEPATKVGPPSYGCAVVLRLAGEIIGRGESMSSPGSSPRPEHVRTAAESAWSAAMRRLPLGEGLTPSQRDARLGLMRQEVLISVELAGPMVKIDSQTYAELNSSLAPGLDGVAAAKGTVIVPMFPGVAASGSVAPADGARRCVSEVSLLSQRAEGKTPEGHAIAALTEPKDLEARHKVTLWRFRASHAAQWRSDEPASLLYRGQRLAVLDDIDERAELWHLATRLAGNLVNRAARDTIGGTLSVASGEWSPSGVFELALAREALHRYWWVGQRHANGTTDDRKGQDAFGERARDAADVYLAAAQRGLASASGPDALAAKALIASNPSNLRMTEGEAVEATIVENRLRSEIAPGVRGVVMLGWTYVGSPNRARAAPAPSLNKGGPTEPKVHDADGALRALMAATPVGELATEMPFLGWAELEIDRQLGRQPGRASAAALREMRSLIWRHQMQGVDAGPDAQDLVGGIVVPGSKNPLPTWQTARLVAFLATMLREPELTTPDQRGPETVRLLNAARFLRQLQVDDTLGWMCADPLAAKGGTRVAVWDQRSSTDATAMSLLATLEIIESIDGVSGRAD